MIRQGLLLCCCSLGALFVISCGSDHGATAGSGGGSAAGSSGAGPASDGGSAGSAAAAGEMLPPATGGAGDPGCGLDAAAFCETFSTRATTLGRAGELDATRWSASRGEAQLPTGNGVVFGIAAATIPTCHAGLPSKVFPNSDALVCDANSAIASKHLLVAAAAQNYGQNSYRIRQPFDFSNRTGKIAFDAEGFVISPLLGWIALDITEDPTPIPSFAIGAPGTTNEEGASVPRNALEVQFNNQCSGATSPQFAVGFIDVLTNYKDAQSTPTSSVCVPSQQGHLNHFEVTVSEHKVEVFASPFSTDGTTFAPVQLMYSADVTLPFSRGYVQLTVHNHATLKYSGPGKGFGADTSLDAWLARWDNVGFDGPVSQRWREYEIPDSLVSGQNSWNVMGPVVSIGYVAADAANGPKDTLHFQGVDISGVQSARLSLASWYPSGDASTVGQFVLRFRLNGGAWHDRKLNSDELALLANGHSQGLISQMLDVPVTELVAGDNTLEFVSANIPQDYPPAVSSIDLVLVTE